MMPRVKRFDLRLRIVKSKKTSQASSRLAAPGKRFQIHLVSSISAVGMLTLHQKFPKMRITQLLNSPALEIRLSGLLRRHTQMRVPEVHTTIRLNACLKSR
jgi:hypothetical protein